MSQDKTLAIINAEHNDYIDWLVANKGYDREDAVRVADIMDYERQPSKRNGLLTINRLIAECEDAMSGISIEFVEGYDGCPACISDAISEFSEGRAYSYGSSIHEFIADNIGYVNDTIEMYGWEECGSNLYEAGRVAKRRMIEEDIYEDLENVWILSALYYLKNKGIKEVESATYENWIYALIHLDEYSEYDKLVDLLERLIAQEDSSNNG